MNPIEINAEGNFEHDGLFEIMNTFNSLTKFITQGSPLEYPVLYAHALQQKYEDFNEYEQEIEEFFIKVRISILCCKHPNSIALYSLRFNYFLDLFIDNLSEDNADFFAEKLPPLYILEHAPTEDMPPIETDEIIPADITLNTLTISQVGAFTLSQDQNLIPSFTTFSGTARSSSTRQANMTTNSRQDAGNTNSKQVFVNK